jgi:hypothetical protein
VKDLPAALRREARQAGVGEALVLALVVTAFYLEPILGGGPWIAALLVTCAAGAVALVLDPGRVKTLPPLLVTFVAVYALAGLLQGHGEGSDVGRYIVRPVAIIALALFLTTPARRRRAIVLTVVAVLPQAVVTCGQAIDTLIDFGRLAAQGGADGVTGTLGDSEANTIGLVAIGAMVLAGALHFAGILSRRATLAIVAAMIGACIFSSTRAALVLIPLTALGLAAGFYVTASRRAARTALAAACVAIGVASAPVVYGGIEGIYPGAFTGAFSNQSSALLGNGNPIEAGGKGKSKGEAYNGPHGVAVLPGRLEQLRLASELSVDDGVKTTAFGRGYGAASVIESAGIGSNVPKPHRTGVTWIGKLMTETGWLGVLAFVALLGWLAWLGVGLARRAADPWDRAIGFAAPGIAALTFAAAFYTTVLDVRAYSALFIVFAAATVAATRGWDGARADEESATESPARRAANPPVAA